MAVNRSINLKRLEESILRDYKRSSYGEETPQYETESIYYSDIPKEIPSTVTGVFKRSIVLYNYSYFEMITFAIFEHLFRSQPQLKDTAMARIKGRICNQDFMLGSHYIKGLLVMAIRDVTEHTDRTAKPIAQSFLKNDAMNAFSEFWKEVIEEQSEVTCIKHTDIPEGEAYRLIANFTGINFQLFWKRENGYEEEHVISQNKLTDEFISIVIFEKNLIESIITKVLEESVVHESNERGYVLLLPESPKLPANESGPLKNAEITGLIVRASAVSKKGSELLNKFRQFYRQMRDEVS